MNGKRFPGRFLSNSIHLKVGFILILTVSMTLTGFAFLNYFTSKAEMEKDLDDFAEFVAAQQSRSLALPIWDMSGKRVGEVLESAMAEKRVYAVLVRELDGKTISYGRRRDPRWNPVHSREEISGAYCFKSRDIEKDGEKLGTAEVYVTYRFMEEKLDVLSMKMSAALVILDIALLSVFFVAIRRYLIHPAGSLIDDLGRQAAQVVHASEQVASASRSMAEGASDQTRALENASLSLEEMSDKAGENAENANKANRLMKEANRTIEAVGHVVSDLAQAMTEMSDMSQEISKIIKAIDEIAFQTNLLALNAAIEAARAGNAGAGFAVVADEVRNLALRSTEAARNTAVLIENTVGKTEESSHLVARVEEAFEDLARSAEKIGRSLDEIDLASGDQSVGIRMINNAVAEIDKVVQRNADGSEVSAEVSEDLKTQAELMKSAVGDLGTMIGRNQGK